MAQIKTRMGKVGGVMRSLAFVRGFQDKLAGRPFNPDAFPYDTDKQWRYERGRAFACIYQGPLKYKSVITYAAERAMQVALWDRSII